MTTKTGAGFFDRLDSGGIGTELHPDRIEGEAKTAIAQLALQQIQRFAAPAKAAKYAHRLGPISFGQHRAQGRHDRGGGMATEGGRANQQRITAADGLDQLIRRGKFAVDTLHPHTGAGHALGQCVGDGGGVAVGTGVEQGHGEAGAFLGLAPAAVIHQQAAPALGNRRAMARRYAANIQLLQPLDDAFHLAGHRRHQAVVEIAAIFFCAAAVGFCPAFGAEMGREELATE